MSKLSPLASKAAITLALAACASVSNAQSRDYVSIVGSSTVYPFATVVAEQFGKATKFKTPKIESTGSGGGLKLFCAGVGAEHPDMTNASRAIKKSELDTCASNGVKEVVEVKIGYDGITLGQSKEGAAVEVTRQELYWALAKEVPDSTGQKLIPNPYMTWKDVNAKLPAVKIEVLGPPPTSGTRDAFVELVMDKGCKGYAVIDALDKKGKRAACRTLREDGAYVEAGENDNLIVQKLVSNPNAMGIFGYSFLDQNSDKIRGIAIEGIMPEFETIADGQYPVSRPLFIYVKKAHVGVIPGMKEFLAELTSDRAWGEEGYLSERGMIPMPEKERALFAGNASNLVGMSDM